SRGRNRSATGVWLMQCLSTGIRSGYSLRVFVFGCRRAGMGAPANGARGLVLPGARYGTIRAPLTGYRDFTMARTSLEKDKIRILLLEGIHESAVATLTNSGYSNIELLKGALTGDELK